MVLVEMTKELGKMYGLKMGSCNLELDEAHKKDAEELCSATYKKKLLGELPVKIPQVTVKNANMFDDPMAKEKRKRIPEGYKPIKANHYDVKVTVKR